MFFKRKKHPTVTWGKIPSGGIASTHCHKYTQWYNLFAMLCCFYCTFTAVLGQSVEQQDRSASQFLQRCVRWPCVIILLSLLVSTGMQVRSWNWRATNVFQIGWISAWFINTYSHSSSVILVRLFNFKLKLFVLRFFCKCMKSIALSEGGFYPTCGAKCPHLITWKLWTLFIIYISSHCPWNLG